MAKEAKAHARQLTELGHVAAAVRAMTPDGRHVTHVMAGVYSDIARAKKVANALRQQGLSRVRKIRGEEGDEVQLDSPRDN